MTDDYQALSRDGVAALRRGDGPAALAAFRTIEAAGRGTHQLRLLLAQAATLTQDAPAAHAALDRVIADEPTNLYALLMKGDLLDHAGDARAATAWYEAALKQAPRAGRLPADLTDKLNRTQGILASRARDFQGHLDATLAGIDRQAAGGRFAEALDILAGRREIYPSQPTNFYYPGLASIQWFDPAAFDWIAPVAAAAPAMLAELEAVMAGDAGLEPYVRPDADRPAKRHALLNDPQWSAVHLYRQGAPVVENAARCPATMAALAHAPLPHIPGRSPMALFSVLRGGTHIPPHNGMLNTRLICHIPLIVPAGCRLRVGNETREVRRFEPMIFDDSIEHEAWNDSGETRVVLLFEIWRPELSAGERDALTTLFGAIGDYGADD